MFDTDYHFTYARFPGSRCGDRCGTALALCLPIFRHFNGPWICTACHHARKFR